MAWEIEQTDIMAYKQSFFTWGRKELIKPKKHTPKVVVVPATWHGAESGPRRLYGLYQGGVFFDALGRRKMILREAFMQLYKRSSAAPIEKLRTEGPLPDTPVPTGAIPLYLAKAHNCPTCKERLGRNSLHDITLRAQEVL
ncbi:hypothetical protein CONLIGDRAFT_667386 [Coniochaeta ligniaria NRRL 30616]|uniref:Uncharacterized protein n=1 Tax=Coniochaeta ligniaria NRRL 30616 TaxID=1408157 RepID=A0A1J7JXR8_9PEZI|nr:hypothetical protein CONLIGDRAFT_667386 [Coniochaeta ligniaria NRRL 30616]